MKSLAIFAHNRSFSLLPFIFLLPVPYSSLLFPFVLDTVHWQPSVKIFVILLHRVRYRLFLKSEWKFSICLRFLRNMGLYFFSCSKNEERSFLRVKENLKPNFIFHNGLFTTITITTTSSPPYIPPSFLLPSLSFLRLGKG